MGLAAVKFDSIPPYVSTEIDDYGLSKYAYIDSTIHNDTLILKLKQRFID